MARSSRKRADMPLTESQLRRRITQRAARMMLGGEARDVVEARRRAACQFGAGTWAPGRLPTIAAIREQLIELAELAASESAPSPPVESQNAWGERYLAARSLLLPLEQIMPSRTRHPEGDLLYHCLQVFHFAREELPYDQDFLWAALLHEVGAALDPRAPEQATLAVLEGLVEPRSLWLIEHLPAIRPLREGSLGMRARRRLVRHPWYPELPTLADCDAAGHQPGLAVDDLDDALAYLRQLEDEQEG
jgi:hypothetical protein